ncbi:hypothetical protein KMZ14_10290 [Acinetobacter schindleri]|uniref:hypothetical protein n=1 Tax=Acinetobacter schindleri TaxID=108981 RepID=UPI002362DD5A|nr:hypothetical protein [Acinetobacter schindleri]WDE15143.1 hypothetical protein KMZ14_10290 [Acinetobacter schindleri]
MKLTPKQIEILQRIESGNLDGSLIDLTQLRISLTYTATKQAVLCSVNHLAKRDLVGRMGRGSRNGSLCTMLAITANGKAILDAYTPSLKSVLIEADEEDSDELDEIFI